MATDYVLRWKDDFPRQAFQLALLGATDKQIAEIFNCNLQTIDYWKRTNKGGFRVALNRGKMQADAKVAEAFFKKATGYTVTEERILLDKGKPVPITVTRHIPPDSWAAFKWLSIRQREMWTDVQRTEITQTNININKFDFTGLSTEELMLVKKLGLKQLTEHVRDN